MSPPSIAHGLELEAQQIDSLPAAIERSISRFPEGKFVHRGTDDRWLSRSYVETWELARRLLGGMRARGLGPGDRVLLRFARSESFVPALWASMMGGLVPVPLTRNDWSRHQARSASRTFASLMATLEGVALVSDDPDAEATAMKAAGVAGSGRARILGFDELVASPPADPRGAGMDDPAVLILTSGTTDRQHLVILSVRAVLHRWWPTMPSGNTAAAFLTWSPFDHVMGLGAAGPNLPLKVHLPTLDFVERPTRWLDAVEEFGITHATMTNFGMSLISKQLEEIAPDRSWRIGAIQKIGVGAEAIEPAVCRRFFRHLEPMGLRRDALILGYGLTECGPVVGGTVPFSLDGSGDDGAPLMLDRPTRGHSVRIVDEVGQILPEGTDGHVQVRGPTMTSGYLGDPGGTAALFTADGWLVTGDLGFLRDGILAITGREKETIILHAKKYACGEIEAVARSVPGVTAAFAVASRPGDTFFLFFVAPGIAPPAIPGTMRRLREVLVSSFGFAPGRVVPLAEGAVPRTPTGKVQRHELAARIEEGTFDRVLEVLEGLASDPSGSTRVPPAGEHETLVTSIWARLLGHEDFGAEDDFFTVGGSSLLSIRMLHEIEQGSGVSVPDQVLHEATTVRRIAAYLSAGALPPIRLRGEASSDRLDPLIERRLLALTASWEGERRVPGGLIVSRNLAGPRPPLFWCMQDEVGLIQLSHRMGPEQPVHALRSGHLIMEYNQRNITSLAQHYMEEIIQIQPAGPYFLAGNCQGGLIAAEISRQLAAGGRPVALLILVETLMLAAFQRRVYQEKVALLAGGTSRLDPRRTFRWPVLGWRKLFPAGYRVTTLPCDHGEYFRGPATGRLVRSVTAAIEWALQPEAPRSGSGRRGYTFPETAYRADFRGPAELSMRPGEARVIEVTVTNTGTNRWGPTARTGITLGNHWLTREGELTVWADGRVHLEAPVEIGGSIDLRLEVRAPAVSGEYAIELDLVEEGVTWFKDRGCRTHRIPVQVG